MAINNTQSDLLKSAGLFKQPAAVEGTYREMINLQDVDALLEKTSAMLAAAQAEIPKFGA